eukprot:Tamp_10940.p5 GENE.Tamp_10940~~Tamp_10940.p5  ORF type:complete len:142 (-),score=7.82 Tamp_10940:1216-1641(-)
MVLPDARGLGLLLLDDLRKRGLGTKETDRTMTRGAAGASCFLSGCTDTFRTANRILTACAPARQPPCLTTRLSCWQPFEVVNIPRSQIAAMLGPRSALQYMPDQNSASPLYGTTDDHDGPGVASGFATKNMNFQYGNVWDP